MAETATRSRKNPLPAEVLQAYREGLTIKRKEVLDLYRHDVKVGQESTDDNADDFADRANNSYNRETMFALSDTERQLMLAIDAAVDRIDDGSFGNCTNCHTDISVPRLDAVPWAEYCIDCQELSESGLL